MDILYLNGGPLKTRKDTAAEWESLEAWNKQYASEEFCGFRFS